MSYITNTIHIIFSTKNRSPWLKQPLRNDLHAYMAGTFKKQFGHIRIIGGVEDHIHILGDLNSSTALSECVKILKTSSTNWLRHEKGLATFSWQGEYAAFSVSSSKVLQVFEYIEKQEAHHKKYSFRDEIIQFLKKHGMEYQEKYIP